MMTRRVCGLMVLAMLATGCTWHKAGFASAEGKAFYLFSPGYTCGGPMAGGARVASWTDKVEVVDGHLVRWGSRCGGEGLPVPAAERARAHLGEGGRTLVLGGKIYRQSADPVKEAEGRP